MATPGIASERTGWLHTVGALTAIAFPLGVLYSFLTSDDSGDTAAELIAYAKDQSGEIWFLQILALLAPVLIGVFVASVATRLRGAHEALRALVLIGGTLFIVFVAVGLTLWAAPLLSSEDLTEAGAEAYLAFDDAGWVLLGLGGIAIGMMIIAVSLAARELGLIPAWAAWVSLALGVIALASIMAVGIFAWIIWLVAAGGFLLSSPRATVADQELDLASR